MHQCDVVEVWTPTRFSGMAVASKLDAPSTRKCVKLGKLTHLKLEFGERRFSWYDLAL